MSLKKKFKIEKKVKEHNKKMKRDAKKNPHKKSKKDPGIPNNWPFKEEMLQDAQRQKEEAEQAKLAKRKEKKIEKKKLTPEELYEKKKQEIIGAKGFKPVQKDISAASKRAHYKELSKIIELSDVIIEVLDARDPNGCRSPDIEKLITSQYKDKKIILLLTKIDLVPGEIVERWLKSLRGELPTLAFKSDARASKFKKAKRVLNKDENATLTTSGSVKSSTVVGAETLIQLLKNYYKTKDTAKTLTVGVIGYPNVGKSSVITSLKGHRNMEAKNTAQDISLDHNIKLISYPGVMLSSSTSTLDNELMPRNCFKPEQMENPVGAVEVIMKRCKQEKLMEIYKIPAFDNMFQFMDRIAHQDPKFLKGEVPDVEAISRMVVADWNSGKIPFFTLPPENSSATSTDSMKEFDVKNIVEQADKAALVGLASLSMCAAVYTPVLSLGFGTVEIFADDGSKDSKKRKADEIEDDDNNEDESGSDEDSDDDNDN